MAIKYAVANGSWSAGATWNGGTLPTSADDVYSNTFTVTVNVSATVNTLNNGATTGVTAGGTFSLTSASNGITLTASNLQNNAGGASYIITSSLPTGNSATLNSNVFLSNQNTNGGIIHNGAGTLNLNGSIASNYYITGMTISAGTLNIVGNAYHSGANANVFNTSGSYTINMNGTFYTSGGNQYCRFTSGTFNLTGTPAISYNGGSYGIDIQSGTANINGEIIGGSAYCVLVNSGGTVNITGTITGSAVGAVSNSSTLTHIGTAQATSTGPAITYGTVGQNTILTGPLLCSPDSFAGAAAAGVNPCVAQRWFPKDTALATFQYQMKAESVVFAARSNRNMYFTDAYASTYPATNNVRSGINYGVGNIYTGTMAVPSPSSVSYGVPVDNTTGNASFLVSDFWGYLVSGITTSGSIGELLKRSATVSVVGQLISDRFSAK